MAEAERDRVAWRVVGSWPRASRAALHTTYGREISVATMPTPPAASPVARTSRNVRVLGRVARQVGGASLS
ncbi:hypothetical protein I6A60_16245 [Frankia sp. AgB1.9]|uniref:hypothetical protein n=1 Tax=unclassified Frankia TaxID=2632575 RepID=UPI0019313EFB|nr:MULTISPECIES: hypothetical protein [unclassified Frankia]MBL7487983.1 hypothetical protein [Frankia sp. AgW1.1]MBL7549421.1 hypothetical protein [Frankia sp. AgB1.9]